MTWVGSVAVRTVARKKLCFWEESARSLSCVDNERGTILRISSGIVYFN